MTDSEADSVWQQAVDLNSEARAAGRSSALCNDNLKTRGRDLRARSGGCRTPYSRATQLRRLRALAQWLLRRRARDYGDLQPAQAHELIDGQDGLRGL